MITNNLTLKPLGSNECTIGGELVQNNIPILEDNYVRKMNANNGFSQNRMFRKIASIGLVEIMKATQEGYNLDDEKDLYRFLSEHPEYMTVDKINSNRPANIIIK